MIYDIHIHGIHFLVVCNLHSLSALRKPKRKSNIGDGDMRPNFGSGMEYIQAELFRWGALHGDPT